MQDTGDVTMTYLELRSSTRYTYSPLSATSSSCFSESSGLAELSECFACTSRRVVAAQRRDVQAFGAYFWRIFFLLGEDGPSSPM